jgi:hypothetical protein
LNLSQAGKADIAHYVLSRMNGLLPKPLLGREVIFHQNQVEMKSISFRQLFTDDFPINAKKFIWATSREDLTLDALVREHRLGDARLFAAELSP